MSTSRLKRNLQKRNVSRNVREATGIAKKERREAHLSTDLYRITTIFRVPLYCRPGSLRGVATSL
jgi:hypothetical protein